MGDVKKWSLIQVCRRGFTYLLTYPVVIDLSTYLHGALYSNTLLYLDTWHPRLSTYGLQNLRFFFAFFLHAIIQRSHSGMLHTIQAMYWRTSSTSDVIRRPILSLEPSHHLQGDSLTPHPLPRIGMLNPSSSIIRTTNQLLPENADFRTTAPGTLFSRRLHIVWGVCDRRRNKVQLHPRPIANWGWGGGVFFLGWVAHGAYSPPAVVVVYQHYGYI